MPTEVQPTWANPEALLPTLSPDTPPEVERIWIDGIRRQPAWKKIALASAFYELALVQSRRALERRCGSLTEEELRCRFRVHWLGEELAGKVETFERRDAIRDRA